MRILVTFAVDAEFAPWRRRHDFRPLRVIPKGTSKGTTIWEADVGECYVSVYLTGIGGRFPRDAMAMRETFFTAGPDFAISSGFAGALRPDYRPGDVLVAEQTSTTGGLHLISAERRLLAVADKCGAATIRRLLTTDRVISKKGEKEKLADIGEAVDMESALIMGDFADLHLPAATIRAVSDTSKEDLPIDFSACLTREGKLRTLKLVRELLFHPNALPPLVRFAKQSLQAARKLAIFLDRYFEALPKAVSAESASQLIATV